MSDTLWNLQPIFRVALTGALIALGPLTWVWLRGRSAAGSRITRLIAIILFLTFDLVIFGAYTRLSDSGLGCPDWPGCYGSASPVGAHQHIEQAQALMPSGAVTHSKAWIEMIHRYLAASVGVLITVLALARVLASRRDASQISQAWWASATLAWVIVQGLFGALTVTLKLYPAIVSLHLLGGLALLALLAVQDALPRARLGVNASLRAVIGVVCGIVLLQIALGAWVSTNYAVLACTDFPTCRGSWWPSEMDFQTGFRVLRPLGQDGQGGWLSAEALMAIHMVHRLGAVVAVLALLGLGRVLRRVAASSASPELARAGLSLWLVAAWQFISGLSNVVLGWPLLAALAHTAGAAAAVVVLTSLRTRARSVPASLPASEPPSPTPALAPAHLAHRTLRPDS